MFYVGVVACLSAWRTRVVLSMTHEGCVLSTIDSLDHTGLGVKKGKAVRLTMLCKGLVAT